ncbi:MAG: hypothetical protein EOO01_02450 [Chitinophagaceae bacterium]|nr:MAG: hypothetical protein EOO01_02450 [Chitinophagaceae bacterium]
MPELPDVEVFTASLNKILTGKKLLRLKVVNGQKLEDSQAVLSKALKGRTLKRVYRSGKEMRFEFSGNALLGLHLMLTGDVFIFQGKNPNKFTILEMYFSGNTGLALTDRMRNAFVKLNPVDKKGVDAISKAMQLRFTCQAVMLILSQLVCP